MNLDQIKPAISAKTPVKHNNINYYIIGCIMRLIGNEWKYQLELHDLKANSVTITKLEDVNMEGE